MDIKTTVEKITNSLNETFDDKEFHYKMPVFDPDYVYDSNFGYINTHNTEMTAEEAKKIYDIIKENGMVVDVVFSLTDSSGKLELVFVVAIPPSQIPQ